MDASFTPPLFTWSAIRLSLTAICRVRDKKRRFRVMSRAVELSHSIETCELCPNPSSPNRFVDNSTYFVHESIGRSAAPVVMQADTRCFLVSWEIGAPPSMSR